MYFVSNFVYFVSNLLKISSEDAVCSPTVVVIGIGSKPPRSHCAWELRRSFTDNVFGSCKVIPFCKKICRERKGREYIQPKNAQPYWRAKSVPKAVCDCELKEFAVPSASPTLNLVENVNGYLRTVWQQQCGPNGKLSWSGGKQKRIDVLDKCVRIVNNDKKFFQKLYSNANTRHEFVRDSGGEIYRFS